MRTLKIVISLLVFILSLCGYADAYNTANFLDRKGIILNTCPYVELSGFSFGNVYDHEGSTFQQNMKWKNVSNQPLVAFEIVILQYDVFNRPMISTLWTVNGKNSADWSLLNPGDSNFDGLRSTEYEEVYTGVAFVHIARLQDGTIWRVSEEKLLDQLRKVAPEIDDFGNLIPDPQQKKVTSV